MSGAAPSARRGLQRIERPGASLAVELAGDDDRGLAAIVFLHAGVADRRMWWAELDAFAAGRRAVAYDRRGFGKTRHEAMEFAHVDDLIAVLDGLGIERAVLVGCSQGGRIALDAALAHPHRVAALVLVCAAMSGERPEPPPLSALAQARVDAVEAADASGDLVALNAAELQLWLDGPEQPAGRVAGPARELFLDMNGIALRASPVGTARPAPSAYARLEQVAVPTLAVAGGLDFAGITSLMREAASRIPDAELSVFADAAHLPNLEQPARFASLLTGFLARRGV